MKSIRIADKGVLVSIGAFQGMGLFLTATDRITIYPVADGKEFCIAINDRLIARQPGSVLLHIESNRKRSKGPMKPRKKRVVRSRSVPISDF